MSNRSDDSGFSAEDLVSDLVGFYRVFGRGPAPLWRAKPLSYESAIRIWDAHEHIKKNLPSWLSYIKPFTHEYNIFSQSI